MDDDEDEEETNFIPYLARVPKESQLFDDKGKELERTIQGNSFCTIVFEKDKTQYVKRVIGIPGDKICIKDGEIYINV